MGRIRLCAFLRQPLAYAGGGARGFSYLKSLLLQVRLAIDRRNWSGTKLACSGGRKKTRCGRLIVRDISLDSQDMGREQKIKEATKCKITHREKDC